MILPLFPLPIFLLPNGVTQLRIFEQRYLNMVKNCEQTKGFVIVFSENGSQLPNQGSWVDIIDFDTGKDGMLNIMVRCKKLVTIKETHSQSDGLLLGEASSFPHWPSINGNERCTSLKKQLRDLFNQYGALGHLYKSPQFEQDDWVVARWLELLPVDFENKKHFYHPNSFIKAVEFLSTIILDENNMHA